MNNTSKNKHHQFVFHGSIIALLVIWLLTLPKFSSKDILSFGFTPQFLNIANSTLTNRHYSEVLSNKKVISEVQREPLYPMALLTSKLVYKNFTSLICIQMVIMISGFFFWITFLRNRYNNYLMCFFFGIILFFAPALSFYPVVLYPYSFQIFFVILALIFLVYAIDLNSLKLYSLSGLCLGMGMHERGSYLLLPPFIFVGLLVFSKLSLVRIEKKKLIWFLMTCFIVITPWLLRNYQHKVLGLNAMTGYTLGYTYGNIADKMPSNDRFLNHYNEYVKQYGTDGGTLNYISDNIVFHNMTYSAADKRVTHIVLKKMLSNPQEVLRIIIDNCRVFPCRLVENVRFTSAVDNNKANSFNSGDPALQKALRNGLFRFYVDYVNHREANLIDLSIFLLFIIGIVYLINKRDVFALVSVIFFSYMLIVNTTMVIFDPRYRGPLDLVIYSFAYFGIMCIIDLAKMLKSNCFNNR